MALAPFLTDNTSNPKKKKGSGAAGAAAKAGAVTTFPGSPQGLFGNLDPAVARAMLNRGTELPGTVLPQPAGTPGQGSGGPDSGLNVYDPNQDYEVQLAHARAGTTRSDAYGDAIKQLEQALLGYGSESLARSSLDPYRAGYESATGHPLDLSSYYSSFAGVNDPSTGFSTLAQRGRANLTGQRDLSNQEAGNNLLYSSTGAGQRNDLSYQQQLTGVNDLNAIQGTVNSFGTGLRNSLSSAQEAEDTAMLNAQGRAFTYALANPGSYAPFAPDASGSSAPPPPPAPPPAPPAPPAPGRASFTPAMLNGGALPNSQPAAPPRPRAAGFAPFARSFRAA